MSSRGRVVIAAFLVVALLSAVGLWRLFTLRFEGGDVFPRYSTLRSDPLGSKALYRSLAAAGLPVERNYRPPEKLSGSGRTIYWLGAGRELLAPDSRPLATELEALALAGNRLVISFAAGEARAAPEIRQAAEHKEQHKKSTPPKAEDPSPWGMELDTLPEPPGDSPASPTARLSAAGEALPAAIPLRDRQHFREHGAPWQGWRPIYSCDGKPVILERPFGKGSIVLVAGSYLFSNEALKKDSSPALLAWLQGAGRLALFDEAHLGVYETPGIMTLVRKHHLLPLLAALAALAILYLWKSAVPFAAPPAPERAGAEESGRDSLSGLVNLLRRSIAPHQMPAACLGEWLKSFSRESARSPALRGDLQALLDAEESRPAGRRDPVALYRKLQELVASLRLK